MPSALVEIFLGEDFGPLNAGTKIATATTDGSGVFTFTWVDNTAQIFARCEEAGLSGSSVLFLAGS
ncbi:MAG: hypothetical protein HC882_08255 [Acidobacteria bacterium]|nr:hypothetical protein [Acidobacteriota bacterium]